MNDTCTHIRQLLSEQGDRTLTTGELTELRAHLATCPGCRAFERDLQAGLAGIVRLPRVSGRPAVRAAVMATVHPGGRSAWPRGWRGWTGQMLKLAGAITAFALVAVILMAVFSGTGNDGSDGRISSTGNQPVAVDEPTATPEPTPAMAADEYVPQPCAPGQVAFEIEVSDHAGNPDSTSPGFVGFTLHALKSTGGVECQLTTPISFQINDGNGMPLEIEGNPAMAELDATLGSSDASVSFAWLNWCGEPTSLSLAVEFMASSDSGSGMGQSLEITPPCDDSNQPSKLGQSMMADALPSSGGCETGQVVLTSSDLGREGDEVYIWAIAGNIAAGNLDGCTAGDRVTVTLADEFGTPLEIEGNQLELMFKPDETGWFQWAGATWTNWCGAPDGAYLTVSRSAAGSPAWIHVTPACLDESRPSQLTPLELAPPDDMWPDNDLGLVMPGLITDPPVCDPAWLDLSMTPIPTHRDIIIEVNAGVYDATAPICWLEGNLTFTISGTDGQPLAIDGNGLTLGDGEYDIVRVVPAPGVSHVIWENWCGEPGPFTITAMTDGQEITTEVASGPDCADESQPSTLQSLADAKVSQ